MNLTVNLHHLYLSTFFETKRISRFNKICLKNLLCPNKCTPTDDGVNSEMAVAKTITMRLEF